MGKTNFTIYCGLGFGIIDVARMIPVSFDSQEQMGRAMSGAFLGKFIRGFLFGLGVGFSIAIITTDYIPII